MVVGAKRSAGDTGVQQSPMSVTGMRTGPVVGATSIINSDFCALHYGGNLLNRLTRKGTPQTTGKGMSL